VTLQDIATELIEIKIRLDRLEGKLPDIEPLYELREAERLIPMPYDLLLHYLSRYRDRYPKRYKLDRRRKRRRLLTATEIRRIRSEILRGEGKRSQLWDKSNEAKDNSVSL
jgi:hypothetical protein